MIRGGRAVALAAAVALAGGAGLAQEPARRGAASALEHPHEFAWRLLAAASRPVPFGQKMVAGWERWDAPSDIFVRRPALPHWPASEGAGPRHQNRQDLFMRPLPGRASRLPFGAQGDCLDLQDEQDVHLNYHVYRYIVAHGLWTPGGLAKWFASRRKVSFPPDAVTLKAEWLTFAGQPTEAKGYFLQLGGATRKGLVGLHISSRVTPNWFWATFEQVDNRCLPRSAYVQPDRFGYPQYAGLAPAGASPSPALRVLFQRYGLSGVWLNYRLVGVQTAFVNLHGVAQRLGNGAIETSLPTTSSCMTCHAQARMNRAGQVQPPLATCGDDGYTGIPDPLWFEFMRRLDFVWAFLDMPPRPPQPAVTCGLGGMESRAAPAPGRR